MELPQMPELMGFSLLLGLLALMATAAVARGWLHAEEERRSQSARQKANGFPLSKSLGAKKQKQHQRIRKEKPQQHNFTHCLLAAALKSHSGNVSCMDFSSNGKYLASCADDRTVRIWSTKDFLQREHRSMRANVELDHATLVRFSPDCRAFIVWLASGETIRVFKMTKREDGGYTFTATPEDFPKKHKAPVINIGIASTGKFIMTVSSDTTILIWNLKGQVLSTINTNQMSNTHAAISPCSRFVASCGFTPDVKVWEVCFGKKGDFQEVVRAFELKGHSAAVYSFAFSSDSRRMASISKDGTWKLWDIDVEYKKQQDPYLLRTGHFDEAGTMLCHLALSPDAQVLALAIGSSIHVYNTRRGEKEECFERVHGERITDLSFDITGRFLASCGDRAVRIFHNTPGHRAVVEEMQSHLKRASNDSTRQRLQQQITQAQEALKSLTTLKK
ncbi:transducin beta-like protein 2 isoform X1 [Nycticebus coucang]|uniref:transducin beta-like protein 2 isoform X1 n=2 Tax=Nycticebus coucang TaxID=9470 RepID=UPI00234C963B|nr:transducin beta-like protein 2 isoform X1 [Nycticebus coucang]